MSCDTEAQLSDFKLGRKPFQFMSYNIYKKNSTKIQESLNLIAQVMNICFFLIIFLHIMTCLYLYVQMKSLKDFKCG